MCVRTQSATSPQVPMDTAPVAAKREESTAALLPERAVPQLEENIMTQTAEETEEVLEELCRTRCASAASEDFMVPSFPQHTFVDVDPECCPEYPDREVDALLSDLESEDAVSCELAQRHTLFLRDGVFDLKETAVDLWFCSSKSWKRRTNGILTWNGIRSGMLWRLLLLQLTVPKIGVFITVASIVVILYVQ